MPPIYKPAVFVTNDMVRLHGNKRFEWLGRFDYVINSGGIKLFPELIEQKLVRSIPGRFFITSRPDEVLGESVLLALGRGTLGLRVFATIAAKNPAFAGTFRVAQSVCSQSFFPGDDLWESCTYLA